MRCHAMQCQLYSFATNVRSRPYTEYVSHAYVPCDENTKLQLVRPCVHACMIPGILLCPCMPIRNEAWYVHYARGAGMCLATYDGTWTYSMMTVIRPQKCVAHIVYKCMCYYVLFTVTDSRYRSQYILTTYRR